MNTANKTNIYESIKKKIREDYQQQIYEERENSHREYASRRVTEIELLSYIASGNFAIIEKRYKQNIEYCLTPSMHKYIEPNTIPLPIPQLSNVSERHALFHHIISVAVCTRTAIDSGVPEHIAYAIGYAYIRGTSQMSDPTIIARLTFSALYELAQLVFEYRHSGCSKITMSCCKYIQKHLHAPITLKDLANAVQRRENYISDLFAKELGIRPINYIRKQKLEYAKTLLLTGNLHVSHISELLSFPSSSAFISYFKKEYQLTPQQFRNQNILF